MTAAVDVMQECRRRGITLVVRGTRLLTRGPKGALPPDLRQMIIENKVQIVRQLSPTSTAPSPPRSVRFFGGCCVPFVPSTDNVTPVTERTMGAEPSGS